VGERERAWRGDTGVGRVPLGWGRRVPEVGERGSEVGGKEPPVGRKEMPQWRRRMSRWVRAPPPTRERADRKCDGRGERRASHGAERADNSVG